MTPCRNFVLTGATIVNHDGIHMADIALVAGKIAALGSAAKEIAGERLDCRGLHIVPGIIDSQVHFREPGLTHKEDLESGSLAAVMGGVTSVFEMPNTDPATTSAEALADKIQRARGRMHCDFAFWIGATAENIDQLPVLECLPGAAGVKIFVGSSTGSLLVEDSTVLEAIFRKIRRRAAFHSESEARLRERTHLRVPGDPASHAQWRDATAAMLSTQKIIALARKTATQVHILHVSTAQEVEFLKAHKDLASVEMTPHHLTLSLEEDSQRLGTLLQMNPPVRTQAHHYALWRGLEQGITDVLGSDHAPHTVEEKAKPYPQSPSGMPGVETLVPVMLTHVHEGRLSLERFVDLTSAGPQRLFGIAGKGRIATGYDADLTIIDLKLQRRVEATMLHSRAGWTPYQDRVLTGWPIATFVRGHRVIWERQLDEPHCGQPITFLQSCAEK